MFFFQNTEQVFQNVSMKQKFFVMGLGGGHITQKLKFAIEYYADKLSLKQRVHVII